MDDAEPGSQAGARRGEGMQASLVGREGRKGGGGGGLQFHAVSVRVKFGQGTRRPPRWPGNNTFLCDGRIMMVRVHARLSVCPRTPACRLDGELRRASCAGPRGAEQRPLPRSTRG